MTNQFYAAIFTTQISKGCSLTKSFINFIQLGQTGIRIRCTGSPQIVAPLGHKRQKA